MDISPASNMAIYSHEICRFRGTSLPQGNRRHVVGIHHGFPKTKELTTPREIPKTPKKAVQLIAKFPPKSQNHTKSTKKSATPFLCVCFGLHIVEKQIGNCWIQSASILLGDVGNVNAFCTTAIFWMFQTLTFFNCSCFLSRLASHQIQAHYIKLWGPQIFKSWYTKKTMKTKPYNTFLWGGDSIIHQKYTVKSC